MQKMVLLTIIIYLFSIKYNVIKLLYEQHKM